MTSLKKLVIVSVFSFLVLSLFLLTFFLVYDFSSPKNLTASIFVSTASSQIIGHWNFDNVYNIGLDSSGLGNNAETIGNIQCSNSPGNGLINFGCNFGQQSNYLKISSVTNDINPKQGAISVWVRPTATGSNRYVIEGMGPDSDRYYIQWTNNQFRVVRGNPATIITLASNVEYNKWYHLVLSWQGNTMYGYVNGVLKGSKTFSTTGKIPTKFNIGNQVAKDNRTFPGWIDEVRFYNKNLTSSEINEIYAEYYNKVCSNNTGCSANLICKEPGDYPGNSRCCYPGECNSSDGCVASDTHFNLSGGKEIFCQEGQWLDVIKIGAIKLQLNDYSLTNLKNKINKLIVKHPKIDLIVTPEYIFYSDYKNDPVIVNCSGNYCKVESIGTIKSNSLKSAVQEIQNIAKQNKVNIALGTIAEKDTVGSINVSFNTMLIIDYNGNIISKKRKFFDWHLNPSLGFDCINNQSHVTCQQLIRMAEITTNSLSLTSNEGTSFKIVPIICAERNNEYLLKKLQNSVADIIVNSEREGDCNFENITSSIQNGQPLANCWTWYFKDIFIGPYINQYNIIKNKGYFLGADGGMGMGGIVNLAKQKLNNLDINNDYVYGEILIFK